MPKWVPPSPTSCKLKWTWSSVFLNTALTKSCYHNPASKFNTDTFDFHNIPIKVEDRRQMLNGEWPSGCSYCSKTEAVGGKSDRQSQNEIPAHWPHNIDLVTKPKIVEVFFNNTCNLSCVYCSPALSSTWADETRKFGPIAVNPRSGSVEVNRDEYRQVVDGFFEWLATNKQDLERLHVLGGEPFLLTETDRLLDTLATATSRLELNLVSNLMIPSHIFQRKVDKLVALVNNKHLSSVVIMASIDGWGAEVDFQRWGIDRELWLTNFNILLNTQEIKLDINVALTCLTIPSLPALITKWNEWNQVKPVGLQGTRVFEPSFLAPEVLPAHLNRPAFEQAINLIPEDTWYKRWSKERFSNLMAVFDKYPEGNVSEMKRLQQYLNELGSRRSINWEEIFPNISMEFEKL